MVKTLLLLGVAFGLAGSAFAGDLWEWAPGHYTYTDARGNLYDGWQWAPGHTTWTSPGGHRTDYWQWAPGHWSVTGD